MNHNFLLNNVLKKIFPCLSLSSRVNFTLNNMCMKLLHKTWGKYLSWQLYMEIRIIKMKLILQVIRIRKNYNTMGTFFFPRLITSLANKIIKNYMISLCVHTPMLKVKDSFWQWIQKTWDSVAILIKSKPNPVKHK